MLSVIMEPLTKLLLHEHNVACAYCVKKRFHVNFPMCDSVDLHFSIV